ncbi:MAG: acyl-CoA dehydrogenase family protein [Desulfosudaceae bacterium]
MIAVTDKGLQLLARSAAEFAKKELTPDREENDKFPFGPFFRHVLDKAYHADFFHTTLPESLDGVGQGASALCLLLERLSREDASLAGIIFAHTAAQEIMLAAGAEETLGAVVQAAADAPAGLIGTPVFSNPADSPPTVRAGNKQEGYFLAGSLAYVVLGGLAGHILVPAVLSGQTDISWFLLENGQPGLTVSEPVHSLGLHACPAVDIQLQGAAGRIIGDENRGQEYYDTMADKMSVAAAAMSTGIMQGSLAEALDYGRRRFQGGRAIINWSEIQMILAKMAVMTKNAEMTLARACQAVDNREKGWAECSRAAALQIQSMASELTTDGIQVLGGVGYMKDFGQEKRFRDARHIQSLLGMVPMKKLRCLAPLI